MRAKGTRIAIIGSVVASFAILGGAAAIAGLSASGFSQPAPDPASIDNDLERWAAEAQDRLGPTRSPSTSLDAVEAAGLAPSEWPWFDDSVPTPEDAIAAAPELQAAIREVPELAALRLLSTREQIGDNGRYFGIHSAWLKVDNTQLIKIHTQLLPAGTTVEYEPGETAMEILGGEAMVRAGEGDISARVIVGDRMVVVRLGLIEGDTPFAYTDRDVIDFATTIAEVLGS